MTTNTDLYADPDEMVQISPQTAVELKQWPSNCRKRRSLTVMFSFRKNARKPKQRQQVKTRTDSPQTSSVTKKQIYCPGRGDISLNQLFCDVKIRKLL